MSPSSSSTARSRASGRHTARPAARNGRKPAGPLQEVLTRLTAVKPGKHHVVSCYLKIEQRDRARGKYLVKVKNRVKALASELPRLGLTAAEIAPLSRDLARVLDWLGEPANLPNTQGVAVFASEGIGLFEAVALPSVHRSRLGVDRTPLVKELAGIEDEFGRILTAVLDRTSARLFEVTAFGVEELPGLRADSTPGKRFHPDKHAQGWGEHAYHNRIREEKQRHFDAIARELFKVDRARPVHGIVLAGPGPEANAVEPFLHSYLVDRLLGTVKLNPKEVSPAIVHEATLAVRQAFERVLEGEVVHDMQEGIGTGWAVNGIGATLKALARGQVRTLIVHADAAQPGFRCGDSGRLALTARECKGEGEPIPVLDVVDDAIEEALRQHVDVQVVFAPEALSKVDGLGALLRFR